MSEERRNCGRQRISDERGDRQVDGMDDIPGRQFLRHALCQFILPAQ